MKDRLELKIIEENKEKDLPRRLVAFDYVIEGLYSRIVLTKNSAPKVLEYERAKIALALKQLDEIEKLSREL